MYVGYSSVFTKQTISKAIVIPILPMQAAMTFSQCISAEKIHSTHLRVSQQFNKCQLINPCYFRGTSDPVSLDVFKGPSFSCGNEGTGTVSSAGAVAQGPSQSCTGDPGAFRFMISSPTNRTSSHFCSMRSTAKSQAGRTREQPWVCGPLGRVLRGREGEEGAAPGQLTLWDQGCDKAGGPSHQVCRSPGVAPPDAVDSDDDDEGGWELDKRRIEEIQVHVPSSYSHVHDEPLVEDRACEPRQRRASWLC